MSTPSTPPVAAQAQVECLGSKPNAKIHLYRKILLEAGPAAAEDDVPMPQQKRSQSSCSQPYQPPIDLASHDTCGPASREPRDEWSPTQAQDAVDGPGSPCRDHRPSAFSHDLEILAFQPSNRAMARTRQGNLGILKPKLNTMNKVETKIQNRIPQVSIAQ